MYKILISDSLAEEGIEILKKVKEFKVDVKLKLPTQELKKIIKDYDALLLRSGTKVTKEIIKAADRFEVPLSGARPSASAKLRELQNLGTLDQDTIDLLESMRQIRNKAVHRDLSRKALSEDDALAYGRVAEQLVARLKSVKPR